MASVVWNVRHRASSVAHTICRDVFFNLLVWRSSPFADHLGKKDIHFREV